MLVYDSTHASVCVGTYLMLGSIARLCIHGSRGALVMSAADWIHDRAVSPAIVLNGRGLAGPTIQ